METTKDQTSEGRSENFQIIVFKQGDEEYALHIDQIKEVVLTPNITRMPQAPSYIRGVANIRGNIIAILDLEEKFNLRRTNTESSGNHYTLVVESDSVKMGILVREVPNTVTVTQKDFDESVNVITDSHTEGGYIKGIIKRANRLIILIDIFKVIDLESAVAIKRQVAA